MSDDYVKDIKDSALDASAMAAIDVAFIALMQKTEMMKPPSLNKPGVEDVLKLFGVHMITDYSIDWMKKNGYWPKI